MDFSTSSVFDQQNGKLLAVPAKIHSYYYAFYSCIVKNSSCCVWEVLGSVNLMSMCQIIDQQHHNLCFSGSFSHLL